MTLLEHYIKEHKILVKPHIRPHLRVLGYVTHHKTFQDEFGNFLALCTDGIVAWVRLADNKVITVQLENIHQQHKQKSTCKRSAKSKPAKPSKLQLRVLRELQDLDIELTPQQQALLKRHGQH